VVLAALTLWALLSAWFLFPLFGLPRFMARVAGALLTAELVALLLMSYAGEKCRERPCGAVAEAARAAASADVPALAGVLLVLATLYAVRLHRAATTRVR
jgi:hypothetical protein